MVDNNSKRPSLGIYRKNLSLMKIYNLILMLHTCIILLSSSVIYYLLPEAEGYEKLQNFGLKNGRK